MKILGKVRLEHFLVIFLLFLGISPSVNAYDDGPKVAACDYKIGQDKGITQCLIRGSGLNQGISWVIFEVKNKIFRWYSNNSSILELINLQGDILKTYPITNSQSQCRPGGREADVYKFENSDYICIYY